MARKMFGIFGSKAEELEIRAVTFNEVPMLHDMERQRTRGASPNNFKMSKVISDAAKVCSPNTRRLKIQDVLDVASLPD